MGAYYTPLGKGCRGSPCRSARALASSALSQNVLCVCTRPDSNERIVMIQRGRMAKCPFCGSQRQAGATYCPNCGRRLPSTAYDPAISISDATLVNTLGDAALVGKWFVFLKAHWLHRSG